MVFEACAVGFKQVAPASQRDAHGRCLPPWDNPELGYMDKVVFAHNVFTGSTGAAVDMDACRADNLNMFVDSVFAGNTGPAVVNGSANSNRLLLASCRLENNTGAPAVDVPAAFLINSVVAYGAGVSDPRGVLRAPVTLEGTIVSAPALPLVGAGGGGPSYLFNSQISAQDAGDSLTLALLANTYVAGAPDHLAAICQAGNTTALLASPTAPFQGSQLLFGGW